MPVPTPLLAAGKGFTFADPFALTILFVGFAIFVAIAALSHQHERAFSASVIYLGLGLAAALVVNLADADWIHPLDDASLIEHLAEIAVIVALFSAGLKVERSVRSSEWTSVWRLLGIAMPLTIAAVALWGDQVMGLSLGAAILLGAMLAPTDPVLAGDLGIGPPGHDEEDEPEPQFAVTAEAGMNDGLAFPFVFLGLFVIEEGGTDWLGTWFAADLLYGIVAGLAIGGAAGVALAWLAVRLRDRRFLATELDGWLAIACVLLIYGLTEIAGGYGFLAAFAGGLGFRRYEHGHEVNRRVHDGAELLEKFGELTLILLLGSMVTLDGLGEPGVSGWLLVPLLLFVIRPATVLLSLIGSRVRTGRERTFVAWFGVRGIGSLYYVAVAIGSGVLAPAEAQRLFWVVAVVVIVSIVVHGITSWPVEKRLLHTDPRTD
ncbi:MAG TPA: cation:proton antiporter [Solirubrobacteraceae bacterium]|nr:cation:proton antiporter [Solirubrobacteraceae bacterium]